MSGFAHRIVPSIEEGAGNGAFPALRGLGRRRRPNRDGRHLESAPIGVMREVEGARMISLLKAWRRAQTLTGDDANAFCDHGFCTRARRLTVCIRQRAHCIHRRLQRQSGRLDDRSRRRQPNGSDPQQSGCRPDSRMVSERLADRVRQRSQRSPGRLADRQRRLESRAAHGRVWGSIGRCTGLVSRRRPVGLCKHARDRVVGDLGDRR